MTPSPTPTLTPVEADQQAIAAIGSKLATDTRNYRVAIAADKASAKLVVASDNSTIAAEKAQMRADKHNPTALPGAKAAYAAARLKLRQDSAAAKARQNQDKAAFTALINADKSSLKVDQHQLREDEKAAKKK